MSTILEEIRQMLLQAVDSEKIISETATHFYESVEEKRRKQPALELKLEQYATLKEYLEEAAENESLDMQEIVEDLQEDIAYTLEDVFDQAEDGGKSTAGYKRKRNCICRKKRPKRASYIR